VLTALADNRILIAFVDGNPRHLKVLSKPTGGAWSTITDLTPQWAVDAQNPLVASPPGGGVVIAVSGASNNYTIPRLFRSTDGVTFGPEEDPLPSQLGGPVAALSASCLDGILVTLGSYTQHRLYASNGAGYTLLATKTWTYIDGSSAQRIANGGVFWGIGSSGTVHEYQAP
jgi:hypothetical protein